ncbi:hypothetical protein CH25_gp70 [Mycobacterium phage EagleEye]|uniref:Uncharacterized protein n=1 Tax=Mycobacterium phage EagleEye TaxID=1429759 RepID=W0LJ55_9CAUD|nr:hypothetical protein CH25_gp70 [Mycobacterium phage EagleEye]AHG23816.1 hypothetical protein PBI_EAGLEEYE_36 [Mycobacterium phage EagleEye]QNJ55878.1 hypothetical protein SEA_PAINTERBOY_35 [Mycobacterium phage PainterBoy]
MSEEDSRTVSAKHRMCRVFQHAWEYTTVKRDGANYLQGLACIRCGTERFMKIDARTGEAGGSKYKYADGYLFKGGGALTVSERAALRLIEVSGHLPRRRRKS